MTVRALTGDWIEELRDAAGAAAAEVYLKRGRSRRFVRAVGTEQASEASEQGWAIRATTDRGSFLRCGTGYPEGAVGWPEPDGLPLRFPEPRPVPEWRPAAEVEAPLASESEIRSLVMAIEKELHRDLPGARIDYLVLEDGQSESWVGNSHGVLETWRGRVAALTLEASTPSKRGTRVRLEAVRREVRQLSPRQLARRLVDLLSVVADGRPLVRDRSEVVVAPRVASRLIAGLWPLFDPRRSSELVEALGRAGSLGGPALTLVDDGRLADGVVAAPVDGEGTPTQAVVLVEEGQFLQSLQPWWTEAEGVRSGGCSRRFSWRDEPRVGPSHLYLRPDGAVRAADLVSSMARGYYLLDSAPEAAFDFPADRFSLAVRGFEMLAGKAKAPVAEVVLVGRISALLAGVRAVARDLEFTPTQRGLFGSPTVRLAGLELREAR